MPSTRLLFFSFRIIIMVDSSDYVMGLSGRPIRVGGKAYKKMVKAKESSNENGLPVTSLASSSNVSIKKVTSKSLSGKSIVKKRKAIVELENTSNEINVAHKRNKQGVSDSNDESKHSTPMSDDEEIEYLDGNDDDDDDDESEDENATVGEHELNLSNSQVSQFVNDILAEKKDELVHAYEALGSSEAFSKKMHKMIQSFIMKRAIQK